ncbi:uncharacterized protein SCHCODRAFT_02594511 [Schizophyllum commune H4-8]|nr:uncharacterized protein SCHCODRAFT_02594511 [Schizophyllum commune H4-8]KAI5885167.1 hypothetical protein SCHCODRAFT_02594511 [Schizophyllum commune H4-8]
MATADLPDEILKEILSLVMSVPDEDFLHGNHGDDFFAGSPFARYGKVSTSTLLLVCKGWLRVGTPLLYHTVVLRSTAQAQALELALAQTPQLGKFVRRLRLEGGFGDHVRGACVKCPNIEELVLLFDYEARDSTAGIRKALKQMNIKHLVLTPSYRRNARSLSVANKNSVELNTAVHEMLVRCKTLNTVTIYPPRAFRYFSNWDRVEEGLGNALRLAPSLQKLNVPINLTWKLFCPNWLPLASYNPHLKVICFDRPKTEDWQKLEPELPNRLLSLVWFKCETSDGDDIMLRPCPLARAPRKVQPMIWRRILDYFYCVDEADFNPFSRKPPSYQSTSNKYRFKVATLSRDFYRIAVESMRSTFVIDGSPALRKFEKSIRQNPHEYDELECLVFRRLYPESAVVQLSDDIFADHDFPSLRRVCGSVVAPGRMSSASLKNLLRKRGRFLVEISGFRVMGSGVLPAASFADLVNIHTFYWHSSVKINTRQYVPPPECFRSLRALWYTGVNSFIKLLEACELPSLRVLWISKVGESTKPFFEKHGSKLEELKIMDVSSDTSDVLDLCPNLMLLRLQSVGEKTTLDCKTSHQKLVKIYIDDGTISREWDPFFLSISRDNLPMLREIIVDSFDYPKTEQDIRKNAWVERAEALLEDGIRLIDRRGLHWVPRLELVTRLRR